MRILSKLFMLVFISALADARIAVDVFYEALCPYCRQFITTQLLRIMQTELAPELALRLYPYGNAHTDANGVTECQHGAEECELNQLETCALFEYPKGETVHFIACVEEPGADIRSCANTILGSEAYETLIDCKQGSKGERYMKQVEAHSKAQNYEYVPWILINGLHQPNAARNLFASVCEHLEAKPPICSKPEVFASFAVSGAPNVCFKTIPVAKNQSS